MSRSSTSRCRPSGATCISRSRACSGSSSGYVLTYGGFLLLGGRAADLLGRRRILVAGTTLFALSSMACGLAQNSGTLVGARLAQGVGAAMMTPAALSILTTTFNQGTDRLKALGAWGAMAGLASAVGVLLGGLLSGGPGWRWVFFVNPPICLAGGPGRLPAGRRRPAPGAVRPLRLRRRHSGHVRHAAGDLRTGPSPVGGLGRDPHHRRTGRLGPLAGRVRRERAEAFESAGATLDLPHQGARPRPT